MRRPSYLVCSIAALHIVGTSVSTLAAQAPAMTPPVATAKPKVDTLHGEILTDNYFWIRDKTNPDVISYLNAENAYTEVKMKHTEALQKKLYDEMLSRIKETDVSVPYRDNGYYYSTKTEKGKNYVIRVRQKGSMRAPEEVFLDDNALAAGKKFSQVGDWAVSPGNTRLAYLHDTTALRVYTLYVKELGTGKMLADSISRVVPSIAWANDSVLFYQKADSARRADAVWRHVVGTPQSSDVEVFHEKDVLDNVGVFRTNDNKYIIISDDGFTSSESRIIPANNAFAAPVVVAPRKANVEYQLDHIDGAFLLTTNEGAQNFKVMRIADDKVGSGQWQEFIPTSDSVFIEFLLPFKNNLVVVQRSGGLRRLRVMDLKTKRADYYVTFPEAAYAVSPTGNAEFDTDSVRFVYQSMLTPPSTYDYSFSTRQRVLKKKVEVPGFDPTKYEVKRFMVKARDGVMVPVSMIVGKEWKQDGTHPLLEYAYGSYGSTTEPTFSSSVLSLVDRGFAYAIAHIRGG